MGPTRQSPDAAAQVAGYYTYRPPHSELAIHLSLEALDGILGDVLTGFGAIPRRGAEVGGILIGRTEAGKIWIDDFVTVACEHRRGPSYLLSEKDRAGFAEMFESRRKADTYPVGLFRSNTRDQNTIDDEDRQLFGQYCPAPSGAFLLIRPQATKTSTAAFLVYKDGVLPDSNENVFPFQRWELEGGAPPPRRPLSDVKPKRRFEPPPGPIAPRTERVTDAAAAPAVEALAEEAPSVETYAYQTPPEPAPPRRRWLWVPLSFIFLAAGVLLGFQAALSLYPKPAAIAPASFQLGLTAEARDENLYIRWNRESAAIAAAERGRLEIHDGRFMRTVDLDASSLRTGSVMYPPLTNAVGLRLQLTIKGTTSVSETLDWTK